MSSSDGGPYIVVSAADHEAYIVLTAVSCLVWTVLVMSIRLYLRLRLNGPFGNDDTAISIGTVLAIVQTGVTLAAVHYGIGETADSLTPGHGERALKLFYAASLLYILAICAAKCSMFLLVARLTRFKRQVLASHILTGFTLLWGIAAVFTAAFQCGLPAPWDSIAQSKCPSLLARWAAIEALGMFIEALICALALWLVWSLQMAMSLKAIVVGAFMLRLLVIIPCTFRLVLLRKDIPSPDVTFNATNVAIATQVALHYTIMAATFPCMRSFLQAFDSGLGATTGLESGAYANGSKYGTNKSDSDYALKSIDKNGGNFRPAKPETYKPDKVTSTTTTITAAGQQQTEREQQQARRTRSKSLESDESKQPIITKTQEWEVRHERRDLN